MRPGAPRCRDFRCAGSGACEENATVSPLVNSTGFLFKKSLLRLRRYHLSDCREPGTAQDASGERAYTATEDVELVYSVLPSAELNLHHGRFFYTHGFGSCTAISFYVDSFIQSKACSTFDDFKEALHKLLRAKCFLQVEK